MDVKLGAHYILDISEADSTLLNDKDFIVLTLKKAVYKAKATLLEEVSYQFTPQGVTAICLLSESHISIHTWPERKYAAVDIFTCGETCNPKLACDFLVAEFKSKKHKLILLDRGLH